MTREQELATHLGKRFVRAPAVLELLGDIVGKSIAILGNDNGYYTNLFCEKGAAVTSVDNDKLRTEELKTNTDCAKCFNSPLEKTPLESGAFDHVLLEMTLQQSATRKKLKERVAEAARVLKDNGKVIITLPHPLGARNLETVNLKKEFPDGHTYFKGGVPVTVTLFREDGSDTFFNEYHWTLEDYADAITNAGLAITKIREPMPVGAGKLKEKFWHEMRQPNYLVLEAVKR